MIREEKYIKSDVNNNNNKWWTIQLFDDDTVITKWGRVGDAGQSKTFPGAGVGFLEKKCREKESARNDEIPYRKLNVIASSGSPVITSTTKTVTDAAIKDIAKKQIKTNNPIVTKLIDYLARVNIYEITTASHGKITYNDTTGLFSTPLGIITQNNIDEANGILVEIGNFIANNKYTTKLSDLTNDYNMLIPCDFGRQKLDIKEFWSDLSKVQQQKQILDNLQASLNIATSPSNDKKANITEEQIFDCQLHLIEDIKIIEKIKNLYNKTKQNVHQCHRLGVKTVYSVNINHVSEKFKSHGSKMQNVWELWHGTKSSGVLSILKSGLIMPKKSSSNVTGRMFSGYPGKEGLYFSDQSTKSLNYSSGGWGGPKDNDCFMFLADVAMGKYFTPNGPRNDLPRPGYDSTFAKAHVSGVYNNEMIVYETSQVNLKYLIEFSNK